MAKKNKHKGQARHFGDKINSAGFKQRPENINRKGRPKSFRRDYRDVLDNGAILWVNKDKVKQRTKDGVEQYGLQLTKQEAIIVKLDRIIAKSKDRISLDAIKFLIKHLDEPHSKKIQVEGNVSHTHQMVLTPMSQILEVESNSPHLISDSSDNINEQ